MQRLGGQAPALKKVRGPEPHPSSRFRHLCCRPHIKFCSSSITQTDKKVNLSNNLHRVRKMCLEHKEQCRNPINDTFVVQVCGCYCKMFRDHFFWTYCKCTREINNIRINRCNMTKKNDLLCESCDAQTSSTREVGETLS